MKKRMKTYALLGATAMGIAMMGQGAKAEGSDYSEAFKGFYTGVEVGLSSTNSNFSTNLGSGNQDASGFAANVFAGYNLVRGRIVLGGEAHLGISSADNNVAVNNAIFGFSNLTVERGLSFGVDAKLGLLLGKAKRVMIYGSVGYVNNRNELLADGVPIATFLGGGNSSNSVSGLRIGGGIEVAVSERIRIRFSAHKQRNQTQTPADFSLPPIAIGITSASLNRSEVQVLGGVLVAF